MIAELAGLWERLVKLDDFTESGCFHKLPPQSQQDLWDQGNAMTSYAEILSRRISRACGND